MTRIGGFSVLTIVAAATEASLISTWRVHIGQVANLPNYTGFTSVWTFFWPCTVAIALVLLGGLSSVRAEPTISRLWFELAYLGLALYFLFVVHRHMWWAYDPSHSGPAL